MRINREMFREYDIRGVADQDLTTEAALVLPELLANTQGNVVTQKCSWELTIGRVHRS